MSKVLQISKDTSFPFEWVEIHGLHDSNGYRCEIYLNDSISENNYVAELFILFRRLFEKDKVNLACFHSNWHFGYRISKEDFEESNPEEVLREYVELELELCGQEDYEGIFDCLDWDYFLPRHISSIVSCLTVYGIKFFNKQEQYFFYFHYSGSIGFYFKNLSDRVKEILDEAKRHYIIKERHNLPFPYNIDEQSEECIYQKDYTVKNLQAIFEQYSLNELTIDSNVRWSDVTSGEFLRGCSFVKKLNIHSFELNDLSFLLEMPQLLSLFLAKVSSSVDILDVSALSNLQVFRCYQDIKKLIGLDRCTALEQVEIYQYRQKDMTSFANAVNMKVMDLRVSSIRSLAGIEGLKHIEQLSLRSCQSLRDISQLRGKESLKELELVSCNQIEDFEVLGNLPNLEALILTNIQRLPSISFIRKLSNLRHLSLTGKTHVLDGDLKPAMELASTRIVHREYYNVEVISSAK